jgi:hypothetical protein
MRPCTWQQVLFDSDSPPPPPRAHSHDAAAESCSVTFGVSNHFPSSGGMRSRSPASGPRRRGKPRNGFLRLRFCRDRQDDGLELRIYISVRKSDARGVMRMRQPCRGLVRPLIFRGLLMLILKREKQKFRILDDWESKCRTDAAGGSTEFGNFECLHLDGNCPFRPLQNLGFHNRPMTWH